MYEFFEGLSLIGYVGVLLWVLFAISIPIKPNWYFNVDERKPRLETFEKFTYLPEKAFIFMGIRFVAIAFSVLVIGLLLTRL